MLRATGLVLRVESKPWTMNDAGSTRSGITRTVRVLVGDADFVDLKYPENLPLPAKGHEIDVAVVASAPGGRLSLNVRGDWDVVVPSQAYATAAS